MVRWTGREEQRDSKHSLSPEKMIRLQESYFYLCVVCTHVCSGACGGQESADPLELESQVAYGCWELNLGLLQEQQALLPAELSLPDPWIVTLRNNVTNEEKTRCLPYKTVNCQ